MAKQLTSRRRARALSSALLLIGLAILLFLDAWWPAIMLVIGIPLAMKQFLLGRYNDMLLSLGVFVGFYIVATFDISWKILIPILFIMGAVYLLLKEYYAGQIVTEDEKEEEINHLIEEDKK